jgi:5-methylcytosine-specific restriction enzyme A
MFRRHWPISARLRIRDRFHGICQMCRQPIDVMGFDLDHHVPLAIGGEDDEENMRPLCRTCHALKTRGEAAAFAREKRLAAKHLGAKAPSRTPLPGGRRSRWKRKLDGTVVRRD